MFPMSTVGDNTLGGGAHGLQCCPHSLTGSIIMGSPNVYALGSPVARVMDNGAHTCPHCPINILATGSFTVHANNIPVVRVGDTVNECCGAGTVITGKATVFSG